MTCAAQDCNLVEYNAAGVAGVRDGHVGRLEAALHAERGQRGRRLLCGHGHQRHPCSSLRPSRCRPPPPAPPPPPRARVLAPAAPPPPSCPAAAQPSRVSVGISLPLLPSSCFYNGASQFCYGPVLLLTYLCGCTQLPGLSLFGYPRQRPAGAAVLLRAADRAGRRQPRRQQRPAEPLRPGGAPARGCARLVVRIYLAQGA